MLTRTILIGAGGTGWAWASVVAYSAMALFTLAMGLLLLGYGLFRAGPELRYVWIGGVVALLPLFGWLVSERFTQVARIEITTEGRWSLRSAVGTEIAALGPEVSRTLVLWRKAGGTSADASEDSLLGRIEAEGRRYPLVTSSRWDLLRQLGYGEVLLQPGGGMDQPSRGGSRVRPLGTEEAEALRLPEHSYDDAGLRLVARWLAES